MKAAAEVAAKIGLWAKKAAKKGANFAAADSAAQVAALALSWQAAPAADLLAESAAQATSP